MSFSMFNIFYIDMLEMHMLVKCLLIDRVQNNDTECIQKIKFRLEYYFMWNLK
jgi:hypothetical protein